MKLPRIKFAVMAFGLLAMAACGGGTVKRVSEPAASIQQLSVGADGTWDVQLRLSNFSSMPMRFDTVSLKLTVGDAEAGTLQSSPSLEIGPESADVVSIALKPSSAGRLMVADTLAGRRSLPYELEGSVSATPRDRSQRNFDIKARSSLSPAPGLPGVLR